MKPITLTLILGLILALALTGCDRDEVIELPPDNPVAFISATPANGDIDVNGTITVTFDDTPTGVAVNAGTVNVVGNTVTITGPFGPGPLVLTINWADGQQTLTYNVKEPTPEGMVLIPAGQFQMGSNFADEPDLPEDVNPDWFRSEQPVHTVHVDAFYMDKYEVTNAQFKAFVDANPEWSKDGIDDKFNGWGYYLYDWNGNNYPAGKADHPVTRVSWYAAMAYAQWAGKRLPTEAEWEYAARGGLEGKTYPWGDTITPDDANYDRWPDGGTTPVGNYAPNGYGLYNMTGNVTEWCLDAYDEDFYQRSPRENPLAGEMTLTELMANYKEVDPDTFRVLRGGSWGRSAQLVRVAYRYGDAPSSTYNDIGFRCVRAVTP